MLKFLLRDSSNAKALVDVKRKSDALTVKSNAKKATVSKIGTEDRPTPVLKKLQPPLPLTRVEAEEIVRSF